MDLVIIKTGGKQYLATPGQKLKIEKIDGEEGGQVAFDEVLLTAEIRGTNTQKDAEIKIGQPFIEGAKVNAKILKQDRADKITVFKYKSKKRFKVKRGHRQPYTLVEIGTVK